MSDTNKTPRVALLTGGSRGIGAAIRNELEARAIRVVAPSSNDLNLASPASIESYFSGPGKRPFDVLVNNAGINVLNAIDAIDTATWEQMVQIDLTAPLRLIQHVVPAMQAKRYGRIVNISSIFSLVTRERRGAYSAVKSGLNGLTRTAAVEFGPHGILVNAVCPGYVATELTTKNNSPQELSRIADTIPLRRLAEPLEIARLVAFLCSEENSYLTGQTVAVDGGLLCV